MNSLFASTGRGLEELLKTELEGFGAQDIRLVPGGVHYSGNDEVMYRSLLWSRVASRILLPLGEFNVFSDLDLYVGAQSIAWDEIFEPESSFVINFQGTNDEIRNSQFGALRIKDAIVDSFTRKNLPRPNVDRDYPHIRINAWLHRDKVSISLDLSGDALHQRNYRHATGQAPLKETLAAAIIMRSGWKPGTPMVDPMCGSGTLLIEAAMMAADRAPGLLRDHWGFYAWKKFNQTEWDKVVADAQQRANLGMQSKQIRFFGYDKDGQVIERAQTNARRAGVAPFISFKRQDAIQLKNPQPEAEVGTVISNPPYGERLENEPALIALHSQLGRILKAQFGGWNLSLFSGSPELLDCLQLRADRQFKAKNGPLDCVQKNYKLRAPIEGQVVGELAPDFANRLRKNIKKLDKWAKQEGIECYRIYDADLPDYNIAIDRYADCVVVQEYAPPKTVEPHKARQRLFDVISVTLQVLELPANKLVLKTRERQKGTQQYQKLATKNDFFEVSEFGAHFWVNLTDYLDTGLFIDHRLARKMLGEMSHNKDFLNLFAYTGTASVHAALGGAKSTTTVDMSRTYLEWAERNFQLNDISGQSHRLIQADCLSWIRESRESFDVIFIDPPTFSNSKRMEESFDVQRDHLSLLTDLQYLLRTGGTIMFSNNKRGFKMDHDGLAAIGLQARDITAKTQSQDFSRNKHIHNCWLVTRIGQE